MGKKKRKGGIHYHITVNVPEFTSATNGVYQATRNAFRLSEEWRSADEAIKLTSVNYQDSITPTTIEPPTETGWYRYSGGNQLMMFSLSISGQWRVFMYNGSVDECTWGYIEQALGVYDLIKVADIYGE
jgi:hypothetical protein